QSSNLVQRTIASVPWCLYAGRAYQDQHRAPDTPQALSEHATIAMVWPGPLQWQLKGPGQQQVVVPIAPRFQSNSLVNLKEAAIANLGIAALPAYICKAELKAGTLQQVLPGWIASEAWMSALIPYRTGLLPAVRALVDFLAAEIPKVTMLPAD